MHILYGIGWGLLAQVLTFLQLQGQLKYEWFKNHLYIVMFMGIPISFMFMQSVKHFVLAFGGEIWPSRLLGFGIGVIVFTVMSELMFKEPITTKTAICLTLSVVILAIQVWWK